MISLKSILRSLAIASVLALSSNRAVAETTLALENAAVEQRLLDDVRYLADDRLEGRGIETKGIQQAAEFIKSQFQAAGLRPGLADGSYFQPFTYALKAEVRPERTRLVLHGPDGKALDLKLGTDYQPLSFGGSGVLQGPIVFAGYGIAAKEFGYDDFAGQDVAGKVLLFLRREPQQGDEKSAFEGTKTTEHATFDSKAQNAWTKRAAGVLLVNDPFSVKDPKEDKLLDPNVRGFQNPIGVPFLHITQAVADQLLASTPLKSVRDAEAAIDKELRPQTQPISGWSADGRVEFRRVNVELQNVVGVIEGKGPRSNETIILGAHYDHLGRGGEGSLAPKSKDIHNGADDNASGTAVLIELARRFGARPEPPPRRLVFIAFSGEERGLIGSRHYVRKSPIFPLEDTLAMVNFDMVGRMRDDKLILYGVKTAAEFAPIIERLEKESGLKLKKVSTGAGPSDNQSFYAQGIPAFHFFTDTHRDYHRPSDDVDKINAEGMRRVADFSIALVDALLSLAEKPKFVKVTSADPHAGLDLPKTSDMAYLGSVPDYGAEVQGVQLNDVTPGSPAETAGLKGGDLLVEFAGAPIRDVTALTIALRKHKAGDKVKVAVLRDGKRQVFEVTLGKRGG